MELALSFVTDSKINSNSHLVLMGLQAAGKTKYRLPALQPMQDTLIFAAFSSSSCEQTAPAKIMILCRNG